MPKSLRDKGFKPATNILDEIRSKQADIAQYRRLLTVSHQKEFEEYLIKINQTHDEIAELEKINKIRGIKMYNLDIAKNIFDSFNPLSKIPFIGAFLSTSTYPSHNFIWKNNKNPNYLQDLYRTGKNGESCVIKHRMDTSTTPPKEKACGLCLLNISKDYNKALEQLFENIDSMEQVAQDLPAGDDLKLKTSDLNTAVVMQTVMELNGHSINHTGKLGDKHGHLNKSRNHKEVIKPRAATLSKKLSDYVTQAEELEKQASRLANRLPEKEKAEFIKRVQMAKKLAEDTKNNHISEVSSRTGEEFLQNQSSVDHAKVLDAARNEMIRVNNELKTIELECERLEKQPPLDLRVKPAAPVSAAI